MRIISGRFRSRKLISPRDDRTTRPIPDRVKESLFSILRGHFEDASVLDAFAGSGAIGLEAVSRGAARVVMIERDRRAADLIQQNVDALGCQDECELVLADALGPAGLARCPKPVDLVFFDPPYRLVLNPDGWLRVQRQFGRVIDLLSDTGFAVLRTPWPFQHVYFIGPNGEVEPFRLEETERGRRPAPVREARRGKGGGGRGAGREELEWTGPDIDVQAIQAQADEDEQAMKDEENAAMPEGWRLERREVDLKLPNAVGPETHVYASTAVYLYMRKKA